MRTYEEVDYAKSRLPDTIVRLNGIPILVKGLVGNRVLYNILGQDEETYCKLSDLDINPVPLGYVNDGNNAFYLTRSPVREDWRQGLRDRSMMAVNSNQFNFGAKALFNTIMGKFPSIEACQSNARMGIPTAFSRIFAVLPGNELQYKGRWNVGIILDKRNYALKNQMDWVREELEEELRAA